MGATRFPSRPEFDPRPQMTPPVKPNRVKVWVSRILVLTGALAIIAGVAIIFWPAALIVGGGLALAIGFLGVNVVDDLADDLEAERG